MSALLLFLYLYLQFREGISIYGHGPARTQMLDEPDIAPASSPISAGTGDPDTPARMSCLRFGQGMVCSPYFFGGFQRASSFRLGTYAFCQFEDDRQDDLFQGFRRTPIDGCPRMHRGCTWLVLRCPLGTIDAKAPVRRLQFLRAGAGSPGRGLALEMLRKRAPSRRMEAQHRAALSVLRVAHCDYSRRSAHLYTIALTARVGGYAPVRDRLVTHSSLLILVMSCAESIGDSAHPLIMLSAVAMTATSLWSLMTLPEPHPSR